MEFCLLGPLAVRSGGAAVPVPPGRQRAVLAALLLNANRVVPAEDLAEALWGPAPPPSARASIQNHVMKLRKALGDGEGRLISTQSGGYVIGVDRVCRARTHAWFPPAPSRAPAPAAARPARAKAHRRAVAGATAPASARRWGRPSRHEPHQRAGDGPAGQFRPGSQAARAAGHGCAAALIA